MSDQDSSDDGLPADYLERIREMYRQEQLQDSSEEEANADEGGDDEGSGNEGSEDGSGSDDEEEEEEEGSDVEPDGNDEELDMYFDNVGIDEDSADEADEEEEEEEEEEEAEDEDGEEVVNEEDEEMGDVEGDGEEGEGDNGQDPNEKCYTCMVGRHRCRHPVSVVYPGKHSTKCVRCYENHRPCTLDTDPRSKNVRNQKLEQARFQGERRALRGEVASNFRRLRADDRATADTIYALRTTQERIMQRLETAQDLAYLRLLFVHKIQQIHNTGDLDRLNEWFNALDPYNLSESIRDNDVDDDPSASDVAEMAFGEDDDEE